ncbi:MAG TPA: hypothetical protein VNK91_02925 [Burkholderiaceae bacterium]|jgi:hypothetical protein|nr:hypothetical protein [Burkholderiaceae bacterium]
MVDFVSFIEGLPQVNRLSTLDLRRYAGLRGGCAVILRSSARKGPTAFAAPLSRNLPRASARAIPASLVKYPG